MKKFTLHNVKDCEMICDHGDVVVLSGKHPWLFHKDGTYIAKLKQVCRAWNMLFLPNNTVFMDGHGDRSYHHGSLVDGEMLWSIPQKGKRSFTPRIMVASPDGKTVYYIYSIRERYYLDILMLDEQTVTTQLLPLEGLPLDACFCESEGTIAILRLDHSNGDIRECIECISPVDVQQRHVLWRGVTGGDCFPVKANNMHILLSDLRVINVKEREEFSLVEKEDRKIRKDMFSVSGYDPIRQLLNIRYLGSESTLIIDCQKRQIAAHYRPISDGYSSGCLIGDEFWIGSSEGIVRRPFPHMDPYPKRFFEDP